MEPLLRLLCFSRPSRSSKGSDGLKKVRLFFYVWLLLSLYLVPSTVHAHAYMDQSSPKQESELSEAPKEIRIKFTEKIDTKLSKATLLDASSRVIKTKLTGEEGIWLVLTVADPLPDGVYKVEWQALSLDTHVTDGSFRFSAGVPLPKIRPAETISLDEPASEPATSANQPTAEPPKQEEAQTAKPEADTNAGTSKNDAADRGQDAEPQNKQNAESTQSPGAAASDRISAPTEGSSQVSPSPQATETEASNESQEKAKTNEHLSTQEYEHHGEVFNNEHHHDHETSHNYGWNTALRILNIFAAFVVGGTIFFRYWLWGNRRNGTDASFGSTIQSERMLYAGILVIYVITGLGQVVQLAQKLSHSSVAEPEFWETAGVILTSTVLGLVSWLRPVILAVLVLLTFDTKTGRNWSAWSRSIMVAGLLLTFPFTGHAFSGETVYGIPILFHTFHMITAVVWFGGLIGLMLQSYVLQKNPDSLRVMDSLMRRFAAIALPMVLLVALTGIILSVLRFGTWSELFHTQYGQVLCWKTGLFLLALMIAAFHRFSLMPKIHRIASNECGTSASVVRKLFWSIRAELLLACLIIVIAGFLSTSPPPD